MLIHKATLADLGVISDLYFEFGREFSKPHLMAPWNPNKIVSVCAKTLASDHQCAFLLLTPKGIPAGLMMGYLDEFCYSDSYYAQDRVFYISQLYRNRPNLKLLLDAFQNWAIEKGCFSISLTALGSRNNEALARLIRPWGYKTEGYQCIKVL